MEDFQHHTQLERTGGMEGDIRMDQELIAAGQIANGHADPSIATKLEQTLQLIFFIGRHRKVSSIYGWVDALVRLYLTRVIAPNVVGSA